MKTLAVPAIFILAVLTLAAPSSAPKDDPCEQYVDTIHRWQDLRLQPIKVVRLDECVIGYRESDTGLINAVGGEDNILQVSNATQVIKYDAHNGVATKVANIGRKGLTEGMHGTATYCSKCHYLLQILLEK